MKPKSNLHPRNRHSGRYDLEKLIQVHQPLAPFVSPNKYGDLSIDFANPIAVKTLNSALLKDYYGIVEWNIPEGYLCPPIPGRADLIHNIADLLGEKNQVRILDIGTGANCIYPIIGHCEYGWSVTGTDVDPVAVENAQKIIQANPDKLRNIEIKLQTSPKNIFKGIVQPEDRFDAVICNPPFHASLADASAGSERKWKNLGRSENQKIEKPVLNFGGQGGELWFPGGEVAFIQLMIQESVQFSKNIKWFSSLVSREINLPLIYDQLKRVRPKAVETLDMGQGQKISRIVAWRF